MQQSWSEYLVGDHNIFLVEAAKAQVGGGQGGEEIETHP